jgi:hypothetical protein
MQLTPMKFAVIEGTEVRVTVATLAEAKIAVKEMKHKKRELALLKRVLTAQHRSARDREARTRPVSVWAKVRKGIGRGFWSLLGMASETVRRQRRRSAEEIARDLEAVTATTINLDHAILQIQGRMLSMG